MSDNIRAYNRDAWDFQVRKGNPWTIPVTSEEVAKAKMGEWGILLTPKKWVPRNWFSDLSGKNLLVGKNILGLASAGGQQGPILAAAGAKVTVFDNSPAQLAQDKMVSDRENLNIQTVEGDMRDLSCFEDESFDLIFHPCSNCFVPNILPVWKESFRVLKPGGFLLSGIVNPVVVTADLELERKGIMQMKYKIPFSEVDHPDDPEIIKFRTAKEPYYFGHTLQDQIGGQLDAGFSLVGFYEDGWKTAPEPVHQFLDCYIATRAMKPLK
jgi:SAM-dependent methyltransferase